MSRFFLQEKENAIIAYILVYKLVVVIDIPTTN